MKGKDIHLKGTLKWESTGMHFLDYKIAGRTPPKYYPKRHLGESYPTAKVGERVDYGGYKQDAPSVPFDKERLKFYKELQTRIQLLKGVMGR